MSYTAVSPLQEQVIPTHPSSHGALIDGEEKFQMLLP
jgi:hypothetical protein